MLHQRLKEFTKERHVDLEKTFMQKFQQIRTEADYAYFLTLLLSFHKQSEQLIGDHINRELVSDVDSRMRSGFLEQDITELVPAFDGHQECDSIPIIDTHAQALGMLYVLEGSTLGGKIVAEMITRRLRISRGLRFFHGYGTETGVMWKKFIHYLDSAITVAEEGEILHAAENTFLGFNLWLVKHE